MHIDDTARSLSELIDAAFADVRWPAWQNLVAPVAPNSFEALEAPSIIAHFGGKRRDEMEPLLNSMLVEELISMSGLAIAYYLPCFLKKLLRERDDFMFTIAMISLLSNRAVKPGVSIWPEFTPEQRTSIHGTVSFVLQHIRSYDLGEIEGEYRDRLQEARRFWG